MKRDLKKNQITMYYALYSDSIPVYDKNGNEELEKTSGYLKPVEFKASLSSGRSDAYDSPFGNNVSYDRVILSPNVSLPITDTSLIWVKNTPTYDAKGNVDPKSADYKVAAKPLDSLNVLKIAIKMNLTSDNTSSTGTGIGTGDGF